MRWPWIGAGIVVLAMVVFPPVGLPKDGQLTRSCYWVIGDLGDYVIDWWRLGIQILAVSAIAIGLDKKRPNA